MDLWQAVNSDNYDALAEDLPRSNPMLQELVEAIGFPGVWRRPERGSALIALSEHEVLKLMARHDVTPHARAARCRRAPWVELCMRRLPGLELVETWPGLTHEEQRTLARQLGRCLGQLHRTPAPVGHPGSLSAFPSWSNGTMEHLLHWYGDCGHLWRRLISLRHAPAGCIPR